MNKKHQQNIYHGHINANLITENVIQIKSKKTKNFDVCAKIRENMCTKKIISRIVVHVLVKMVEILKVLLMIQQLDVMKL